MTKREVMFMLRIYDPKQLVSADRKRIEINIDAIMKVIHIAENRVHE